MVPRPALICVVRVERNFSVALASSFDLERVSAAPLLFSKVLGLVSLYFSCPFRLWPFFCAPEHSHLLRVPLHIPPHCSSHHLGDGGSLHCQVSVSLVFCNLSFVGQKVFS